MKQALCSECGRWLDVFDEEAGSWRVDVHVATLLNDGERLHRAWCFDCTDTVDKARESAPVSYQRDEDGKRRRIGCWRARIGYWVSFTRTCTGCYEVGDYGSGSHLYGYDAKAQCSVGGGCDECGYTGKRRETDFVPFLEDWKPTELRRTA